MIWFIVDMALPIFDTLEDLNEDSIQSLLAEIEREEIFDSKKFGLQERLNKLNSENRRIQEELKRTPNVKRFREQSRAYLSAVLEISREYRALLG